MQIVTLTFVPIVFTGVSLKCFNGRATAARFYVGLCITSPTRNAFPFSPVDILCQRSATIPHDLLTFYVIQIQYRLITSAMKFVSYFYINILCPFQISESVIVKQVLYFFNKNL